MRRAAVGLLLSALAPRRPSQRRSQDVDANTIAAGVRVRATSPAGVAGLS